MKEKYFVMILAMVLIAVLFFMVSTRMINSKLNQIEQYDKKIKTAQEKLNSARIMDQQLSQFALIIDNSLTKKKSFSIEEVNNFIKKLGDLADQNKIALIRLTDKEVFSSSKLVERSFILELNSTYVQLGQFLGDIEALDNIVKVNAIDVTPSTDNLNKDKKKTGLQESRYKVILELSVLKVFKEA